MSPVETGKPLVQHVVDQARKCRRVSEVIVATDDQRIVDALRPFETHVVMTSPTHQSGTDRIAEVAADLTSDIIVNVQGDEPEIEPETIDALIERLENVGQDDMATAATPFPPAADPADPNLVKVVMDAGRPGDLFFAVADSVSSRCDFTAELQRIIYIWEFTPTGVNSAEVCRWPPTPWKRPKSWNSLRALEHGRSIYVLKIDRATHGIDTPEQYAEFVRRY